VGRIILIGRLRWTSFDVFRHLSVMILKPAFLD
jgi:hypothetical protein